MIEKRQSLKQFAYTIFSTYNESQIIDFEKVVSEVYDACLYSGYECTISDIDTFLQAYLTEC